MEWALQSATSTTMDFAICISQTTVATTSIAIEGMERSKT